MKKVITIPSQTKYIRTAVFTLMDFLMKSVPIREWRLELALSEAMTNGVIHGNKKNPHKRVQAEASITETSISFKVSDQGDGFDYFNLPDPTTPENFTKTNGRGLFLIHKVMDEVRFNSKGNQIVMTKFFEEPPRTLNEEKLEARHPSKHRGPFRERSSLLLRPSSLRCALTATAQPRGRSPHICPSHRGIPSLSCPNPRHMLGY